jgi:hypothetical protein
MGFSSISIFPQLVDGEPASHGGAAAGCEEDGEDLKLGLDCGCCSCGRRVREVHGAGM